MAGVIRALGAQPNTYFVDIGNWTRAQGRQDELKAETVAQVFGGLKPAYLNIGQNELRLGEGYLRALDEMAEGKLNSASLAIEGVTSGEIIAGKLIFAGAIAGRTEQPELMNANVLLLSGDRDSAKKIAEQQGPCLIIHSLHGDPTKTPLTVNGSTLVSPGDRGRYVGRIELINGEWKNLSFIELGPEHRDDPAATDVYRMYLQRVTDEDLLGKIPRLDSEVKFVGSDKCFSCHTDAEKTWKASAHAHALHTLEKTGNQRDPDCVSCHVVGLRYESGFKDVKSTPNMKDVGCESCHGPGENHVKWPKLAYGKAGEKSCLPCHTPDNSPGFDFKTYWEKIKH